MLTDPSSAAPLLEGDRTADADADAPRPAVREASGWSTSGTFTNLYERLRCSCEGSVVTSHLDRRGLVWGGVGVAILLVARHGRRPLRATEV